MKIVSGIFLFFICSLQGLLAQELDTIAANDYYQKARFHGDAANYERSISFYEQARDSYKEALYWPGYVKSLNGLGACHTLLSRHNQAQEHLQLALSVGLDKLGKVAEIGETYQNLGFDWSRQGHYEKQLDSYKKALEIRRNVFGEVHPKVAQSYSSLSVSFKYLGDYENALKNANKGLEIRLKSVGSNDFTLSQDYTNIGAIYLSKGEFKNAQEYFERALDVMENASGEQNQFKAIGYSNLGKSLDAQGHYDQAIVAYENALEVLIGLLGEKHVYAGIFYNNLGAAWLNNGNATKALHYHENALNIFTAALSERHPYVATTYINMGKSYGDLNNELKALEYFNRGLAIQGTVLGQSHPEYTNTHLLMGTYFAKLGSWDDALSHFQKGMACLSTNLDETNIYANPSLSEVASKNMLLGLLASKAKALLSRYQQNGQNILDLEGSLATCQIALQLIDLLKYDITSTISKQEFIAKSVPVYEKSIEVSLELFKQNGNWEHAIQAFEFSEKSKAFLLLQELKYAEIKKYAGIPDSIVDQEKNLNIKSTFYQSELYSAIQKKDSIKAKLYREKLLHTRTEHEALRKEIENGYSRYHQLKYGTEALSVVDVQQKLLDDESLFLEFFSGNDQLYLFAVTKDSYDVRILVKTESYEKWIHDFREGLTNYQLVIDANPKTKQKFAEAAHGLYGLLLRESLGTMKQSVKRIIVVPDGELSYLNFEALMTDSPSNPGKFKYRDVAFLIKDYAISYAYSGTFLRNTMETAQLSTNGTTGSAFGGYAPKYTSAMVVTPVVGRDEEIGGYEDGVMIDLPGAEREVQSIAERLNGKAWLGVEATERNFKETAHDYQILHLAMHGLLDDNNPMFSKLLFGQDEAGAEDGHLNAAEIYDLELNADLTVLSACESGYGKINKGEGMMSLSRAFAYAGCPNLVASLWKVPDETTVAPMIGFYDHLMAGLPIDKALQKSKLEYLQNIDNPLYEHPYFWAGFVVHGNSEPLNIRPSRAWRYGYVAVAVLTGLIGLYWVRKRKQSTKSLV